MQDLARKNADGTAGLLLAAPDALQELWTAWSSITWTATGGIHKKKKPSLVRLTKRKKKLYMLVFMRCNATGSEAQGVDLESTCIHR